MGLFVLRPINDFVAFYEHEVQADSATHYVMSELAGGLQGKKPAKSAFYAVAGGIIGLFSAIFYIGINDHFGRYQIPKNGAKGFTSRAIGASLF